MISIFLVFGHFLSKNKKRGRLLFDKDEFFGVWGTQSRADPANHAEQTMQTMQSRPCKLAKYMQLLYYLAFYRDAHI